MMCPKCGSRDVKRIARKGYQVQCQRCGYEGPPMGSVM